MLKRFLVDLLKPELNTSKTQKTISLTIASMVNSLLNVILAMGATRLLTKTDIAINNQTILAYTTVSPFLTLGVTSGIYYHLTKNDNRLLAAIKECFWTVLIPCLIFVFFVACGGNRLLAGLFHNDAIEYTLFYLIPYTLLITPSTICNCIMVFTNRIKFNAIYSVFQTFVILFCSGISMLVCKNANDMLLARISASCILAILLIQITFSVLPDDEQKMELASVKDLLRISLPLGLSAIVGSLALNLDKWLVSTLLTPEIYAVYSQAARELPLIHTITGSVSTVIVVELTKAINNRQYLMAMNLFKRTALKTSMILMPIMVFCISNAKTIITFFFTNNFIDAVPTFQLYQLYMPIRVVIFGPILIALGKSKIILLKTIGDLSFNLILSYYFVKQFGAMGAAIGTIISVYTLDLPITLYTIKKETGLLYKQILPFYEIFICVVLSLPGGVAAFLLENYFFKDIPPHYLIVLEFSVFSIITFVMYFKYYKLDINSILNKVFRKGNA